MRFFALRLDRKLLLAAAIAALLSIPATPSQAQPDPPAQGGRISYITGTVSIQPAGSDDWEQAVSNLPIGPGDRVFTDSDGQAEVQVGQTFVRIGPNADVSLVNANPQGIYFGVAQGAVHVHSFGLWDGQAVYLNTPSGTSSIEQPGELRVDVYPDQQATVFTNVGTNTMIRGAQGFFQDIGSGEAFELVGSNPVYPQWYEQAPPDGLDYFSQHRDQQIAQAASYQYVSREVPGAYELDAAGTWQGNTPYGPVWYPNQVEAGWAPYRNGHWINHAPWGWVWVEDESWGYAPFHYGRWVSYNGRWGWIPGPPAEHPVWSPALVVFAGGISIGGGGVSAWFPLGPGEAYHPWYPCSPRYIDRVNITNIVEAPRVHVQTTYVNITVTNITYVNRTIAVTAMRQEDFASGRPAREAAVKVDVNMMAHAQPMAQPQLPRPTAAAMVGHPPARPILINSNGKAISAEPGAKPMDPPVKPAPPVRALPGRQATTPPANARPQSVPSKPQANAVAPKPAPAEKAAPEKPMAEKPNAEKPNMEKPVEKAPMEKPAAPVETKPAVKPAPEAAKPMESKPAAPMPPKPAVKPAPEPGKPVEPKPAVKPMPEPAKPAAKPATEPAKSAVKPVTPTPAVKIAPEPVKPAPATATKPVAKPGTTPPAKNEKDKKNDKTKDETDKDKKPE
jgi:hypothetical protein